MCSSDLLHRHRGPFWMRRGNGEPLRRDPAERLAGGVAAGLALQRRRASQLPK